MTEPRTAAEIATDEFVRDYAPWRGQFGPWTWEDEERNILTRQCLCCGRPRHFQETIESHIAEHGMDGMGIYTTADGFARDGHHRVVAAIRLGIKHVQLESMADAQARWIRDHGYVDWEHRKFGDR